MEISVKAVKKMLTDEINTLYENAMSIMYKAYANDMQKQLVRNGYDALIEKLKAAKTVDDLDEVVAYAGYRMSLQEWLDSY